uniref:Uncharacterized protein n=1 Tax=Leersia perrieri TaxID=77586 RepID=A0A0D9XHL7_9ORYZ
MSSPPPRSHEAKAHIILVESQRRCVELLIIGHRRFSSFLGLRGASGSSIGQDSTSEFLIEHNKCITITNDQGP